MNTILLKTHGVWQACMPDASECYRRNAMFGRLEENSQYHGCRSIPNIHPDRFCVISVPSLLLLIDLPDLLDFLRLASHRFHLSFATSRTNYSNDSNHQLPIDNTPIT
jgi:hypothetical protein